MPKDKDEDRGPVPPRPGSLFEPYQPPQSPITLPPPGPPTPRAPLRRWLLLVPAVTLVAGVALGFALGSAQARGAPTSAPTTRPPATRPAPPRTTAAPRSVASPACLETARRADQIIELLITNKRDRAAHQLVAYTVASRQCRRDASP
jgi:hypothetical protein